MWVLPVERRMASAYGSSLKDEAHKKWRNECLQQITRSRDMDRHFKELLAKDRVFAREKHFKPEDIEICKERRCYRTYAETYKDQIFKSNL